MNDLFEKPQKISKRLHEETGEYDRKPNDPEYFKKYWQENNFRIKCNRCDAMIAKLRMCKHIKSQKCMAVAKERMAYQTAILLLEERGRELDKQISELKNKS
jgi:hypothetical protein